MLEISDLSVRYSGVLALENVSMKFDHASITTIIGSNGAGKTSLLNAIAAIVASASGQIRFDGEPLTGLRPESIVAKGVVLVPEGRRIFPRMSVRDNLLTGAHLVNNAAKVSATFEKVLGYFPVLGRRKKQMAGSLSGGEQQMLAIGRALMAQPKMLLLDEPSTGLAPLVEQEVIDTVTKLARNEGVGVVLVEQNASLALASANYAYVLEAGSTSLSGPASELIGDQRVRAAYLGL